MHPPPVIDRIAAGVCLSGIEGSVDQFVNELFVVDAPAVDRRGEVLHLLLHDGRSVRPEASVIEYPVETVFSARISGLYQVDPRYDAASVLQELFFPVTSLFGTPRKPDLRVRVEPGRACGKSVDVRDPAVDGVIRPESDPVILSEGGRQASDQEIRLVHTRVIGGYSVAGKIDRAVHDPHLGVFNSGLQALFHHSGRCRKDNVVFVRIAGCKRADQFLRLTAVFEFDRVDVPAELFHQLIRAEFMSVDPA